MNFYTHQDPYEPLIERWFYYFLQELILEKKLPEGWAWEDNKIGTAWGPDGGFCGPSYDGGPGLVTNKHVPLAVIAAVCLAHFGESWHLCYRPT